MKKSITYCALLGILLVIVMIAVALCKPEKKHTPPKPEVPPRTQAPSRMIEMGPVGTNITSSEMVGSTLIKITASRIWFKKSKTFGFDNAMLKRLAAKDFSMTVSQKGKKILSVQKGLVEIPMDRSIIDIRHPKVLFPEKTPPPDSIRLDKSRKLLIVITGNMEKTWDL